jgi:hypothetical protein
MLHEKEKIENYKKLIRILEGLYTRDMLNYFYLAWQYNFEQKNKTPVIAVSFSNKYFKDIEKYEYPQDTYSNITSHYLSTESLIEEFWAVIKNIANNNLINPQVPEVNQVHIKDILSSTFTLFINQKIKSLRFGNEPVITNGGKLIDNLTLEIQGNYLNKNTNIFKWDINLLGRSNYREFGKHIIEVLNIE